MALKPDWPETAQFIINLRAASRLAQRWAPSGCTKYAALDSYAN
jgi:hypothetical protein